MVEKFGRRWRWLASQGRYSCYVTAGTPRSKWQGLSRSLGTLTLSAMPPTTLSCMNCTACTGKRSPPRKYGEEDINYFLWPVTCYTGKVICILITTVKRYLEEDRDTFIKMKLEYSADVFVESWICLKGATECSCGKWNVYPLCKRDGKENIQRSDNTFVILLLLLTLLWMDGNDKIDN